MSGQSPGPNDELQVAPIRLRRRRGPEPAVFVAVGLVVFLAVAIAKPWQVTTPGQATNQALRSAQVPTAAAASRSTAQPFVAAPTLSPEQLSAALGSHGSWGVAAIGTRPTVTAATEVWVAMDRAPAGNADGGDPTVYLPTAGYAVRALAITSPPGEILLIGRSWRLTPGADPEPLVLQPFRGQARSSPTVLIPPPDGLFAVDRWLPGTYRFEVLLATHTAELTVLVIGRAGGRRV